MFHLINRIRLAFMCLVLLIPSLASAQTAPSVEQAFTPLVLPPAPPRVRTPDQRLCDAASEVQGPLEVLSETVIEPYDATSPFHREALYRWMVQDLIRTGGALLAGRPELTAEQALNLVRRQYSVQGVTEQMCRRIPSGTPCAIRFAWNATFQQQRWCSVAELGRRIGPGEAGFVQGSLDGRVCIGGRGLLGANPFPCPTVTRPLTIRHQQTHAEVTVRPGAPNTMTGDAVGDAFGFGGLGAPSGGWGGGGTGEGTIGMGNIGTMGAGSGTGSAAGFGSGAGRGLRARGTGPVVRAAPVDPPAPREESEE